MERLCTHPNVGARAAGFARMRRIQQGRAAGDDAQVRPAGHGWSVIQDTGGTRKTHRRRTGLGRADSEAAREHAARADGASTSWWSAPSAAARTPPAGSPRIPRWGAHSISWSSSNATCIFEETGELIGMEHWMAERAATPELGQEIINTVAKAAKLLRDAWVMRASRPAMPTAGSRRSRRNRSARMRRAGSRASPASSSRAMCRFAGGLYLMDVVPDGEPALRLSQHQRQRRDRGDDRMRQPRDHCSRPAAARWSARPSRRSSRSAPTRRPTSACPTTWTWTPAAFSKVVPRSTKSAAKSTTSSWRSPTARKTKSEELGHQEFMLTYKSFEPLGPACFPSAA